MIEVLEARRHLSGTPVASFGIKGEAYIATANDVSRIAAAMDGKILVLTLNLKHEVELTRLTVNGHLDKTFNGTGHALVANFSSFSADIGSVSVAPDGGIVVAYSNLLQVIVTRFKANGHRDRSFGNAGSFIQDDSSFGYYDLINLASIDRLGRIDVFYDHIIPEATEHRTLRLKPTGTIDPTFGKGLGIYGFVTTQLGSDGRLYGASEWAVYRLNDNGSTDPNYGTAGHVLIKDNTNYTGGQFAVGSDGTVLSYGADSKGAFLTRISSKGRVDAAFGTGGKITVDGAGYRGSIVLDEANNIVVTAPFDSGVRRYFADGRLDTAFGQRGLVYLPSQSHATFYNPPSLLLVNPTTLLYSTRPFGGLGSEMRGTTTVGEIAL